MTSTLPKLLLLGTVMAMLVGCTRQSSTPTPTKSPNATPTSTHRQLKLGTFKVVTPSPKPSPTSSCGDKLAVNLLLDTSSSMVRDVVPNGNGGFTTTPNDRLIKLKAAVQMFGSLLKNEDIIGVQQFNGAPFDATGSGPDTAIVVPVDTWQTNKAQFDNSINSLRAMGSTHTKDGFMLSQTEIAKGKSTFPGSQWVMVVLTDGVPKDQPIFANDPSSALPDETQNPTQVANALKASGIRVIAIGLSIDKLWPPENISYAKNLLKTIASSPGDVYENVTPEQLESVYKDIGKSLCRQ